MKADFSSVYHYADFQGFSELRRQAREETPEAAEAVARQFEALFIQMMLKSMQDAVLVDSDLMSDQLRFHREMFDRQIAQELARGEGIGLRESLLRQLVPEESDAPAITELRMPTRRLPVLERRSVAPEHTASAPEKTTGVAPTEARRPAMATESRPGAAAANPAGASWRPDSPEAFIRDLWPHAKRAGAALGIAPEVLLAQSALETGWGRHVIRRGDGTSSHNLFGIKAGTRWNGPRAHVQTLEYVNGVPERQRAAFRAYDSPAESFADYVDFLQRNPRYREALAQAPDPEGYLRGLQAAGYATDPAYANKILDILNRGTLQRMVELKSGASLPTSRS